MEWLENFTKGYSKYEIPNKLYTSQSTISRDIHYFQKEMQKNNGIMVKDYSKYIEIHC
jgi:hypothetical protein